MNWIDYLLILLVISTGSYLVATGHGGVILECVVVLVSVLN